MKAEGEFSAADASRPLWIPKSTLEYRIRAQQKGIFGEIGGNQHPLTDLKRELVQLKMKQDVFKKPQHSIPPFGKKNKLNRVVDEHFSSRLGIFYLRPTADLGLPVLFYLKLRDEFLRNHHYCRKNKSAQCNTLLDLFDVTR
ncbi:MAG: hypothetical protein Q8R88_14390 [Desulfoprunum sp.]|nr:hypothetical protein [Desulfoprunum sp.]